MLEIRIVGSDSNVLVQIYTKLKGNAQHKSQISHIYFYGIYKVINQYN